MSQLSDQSRARAEANRAARAADKSTRKLGKKKKAGRAPSTASPYHCKRKYSNRARAHRASGSAVAKLLYDFRLDRPEDQRDDLDYVYICAPDGTPESAFDPIAMAYASEQSLGRKANMRARIMSHDTIALPAALNREQRHALVRKLADLYQHTMGVPIYCAAHLPDPGRLNNHLHLSHPLRHVHDDGNGGFRLGDKIMFEQRPAVREAAGLPRTNHAELRNLRMQVAATIANEMVAAGLDYNECERWRYGYLKLHEQVKKASERGDIDFVNDNVGRDPTKHEGPRTSAWRVESQDTKRKAANAHNQDAAASQIGPETLTRTLVQRVLSQSEKAGLSDPEHFRMLSRDMGLRVEWTRKKGGKDSPVTGVRFAMTDGPAIAGKEVGASIHDLKRRFEWDRLPEYVRYPAKSGHQFDTYVQAVQASGLDVTPGHPQDMLSNAVVATSKQAERMRAAAAASAASAAGTSAEGAGSTLPGPIESDTPVSTTTTAQEGSNMVMHFKKAPQQKPRQQPDSKSIGDTAGTVANVAGAAKFIPIPPVAAGAAAIETGARAVQLAGKIDQATGGKASRMASPMAGLKGIPGLGSGGGMKPGNQQQQQRHRPKHRP